MSKQIEEDAIDYLKMALKKSKYVTREISEGDREPIWDGHIYFYKSIDKRNEDLLERIPVQVKGKAAKYNADIGYPILRNNLEQYLKEGGVIYFVVYLKDDMPTVTYTSLTPKTIKRILQNSDKKKRKIQNISVKTRPLPDNEKELNFVFFNFIQKRKYQKGFAHVEWKNHDSLFENSEKLDGEFQFKFIGNDYLDILDYAHSGELDLYYKPKGASISEPLIDDISDLQLFKEKEMIVQIQGKERIYKSNFIYKTKNDYTIDFKNGCTLKVERSSDIVKMTLNYSLSKYLSQRLDGLEFILEVQKNHGITLNNGKIPFSEENIAKIDSDFLEKSLVANIKLKAILDKLNIKKELDSTGWTQKDSRVIETLYDALINENVVTLDRTDYNFLQIIQFANIKVLLFLVREEASSKDYRIYNYCDYQMVLIGENRQQFSKYEAVELEQLLLIDNFDISDYLSSYLKNEIPIENVDLGLLKLINLADHKCDNNILNYCLEFAQKLIDIEETKNNRLNLLQVKKRLNTLSEQDRVYLLSLMSDKSVEIRFAAACILEYKEQANYLFENEFSDELRERFIEFPIYKLLEFR